MPDTDWVQQGLLREKENLDLFSVLAAGCIFSLIMLKEGNDETSYLFMEIAFC